MVGEASSMLAVAMTMGLKPVQKKSKPSDTSSSEVVTPQSTPSPVPYAKPCPLPGPVFSDPDTEGLNVDAGNELKGGGGGWVMEGKESELLTQFPGNWEHLTDEQIAADRMKDKKMAERPENERVCEFEIVEDNFRTRVTLHGGGLTQEPPGYVKRKYVVRLATGAYAMVFGVLRASGLLGNEVQLLTLAPGATQLVVSEFRQAGVVKLRATEKSWKVAKLIATRPHISDVLSKAFPDVLHIAPTAQYVDFDPRADMDKDLTGGVTSKGGRFRRSKHFEQEIVPGEKGTITQILAGGILNTSSGVYVAPRMVVALSGDGLTAAHHAVKQILGNTKACDGWWVELVAKDKNAQPRIVSLSECTPTTKQCTVEEWARVEAATTMEKTMEMMYKTNSDLVDIHLRVPPWAAPATSKTGRRERVKVDLAKKNCESDKPATKKQRAPAPKKEDTGAKGLRGATRGSGRGGRGGSGRVVGGRGRRGGEGGNGAGALAIGGGPGEIGNGSLVLWDPNSNPQPNPLRSPLNNTSQSSLVVATYELPAEEEAACKETQCSVKVLASAAKNPGLLENIFMENKLSYSKQAHVYAAIDAYRLQNDLICLQHRG